MTTFNSVLISTTVPVADKPGVMETSSVPLTPAAKVMQNDLIFPLIAKNLPPEALIQLRPTCKTWSTNFVPHIKVKHPEIHQDALSRSSASKSQLQVFTEVMRSSSGGYPSQKYQILDLTIADAQAVEEFFAICGESITSLSLESRVDGNEDLVNVKVNVDKIREIVYQLAPNLVKLSIAAYDDHDPYSTDRPAPASDSERRTLVKELPKLRRLKFVVIGSLEPRYEELLKELLRSAVGLEHLKVDQLDYNPGITVTVVSRERDSFLHLDKLKTLKLFSVETRELQILLELTNREQNSLRLETFSTSIVYLDEERNAEIAQLFHSFLVTQAGTLRNLKLGTRGRPNFWFEDDRTPATTTIHIPRLEALSYFCLNRTGWKNFRVQFDGGNLAGNFPSLNRLKYEAHADRESCPPLMSEADVAAIQAAEVATLAHEGVTDLSLSVVMDNEVFAQLEPALPSVTRLECKFNCHYSDKFPTLLTMWPATLTIFHLEYSAYMEIDLDLDSILSGIPASTLASFKDEITMTTTLDWARELCGVHKTEPGLSDLRNLKELILPASIDAGKENIDARINLTDLGGYLGLAMATPALQHMAVWIQSYGNSEKKHVLSERCMTVIRSAFSVGAVNEL